MAALEDGKIEFKVYLTRSAEEWFNQYSSIRLESESEHGSNVSLSLAPDEAAKLYLKRVRVTVEVVG